MRNFFKSGWLIGLSVCLLTGCDLKENEVLPTENFVQIYETGEFERAYIPLDVQPTPDGGYLMLAGATTESSSYLAAYLLKVDKVGKVEWEHLSESFENPVSELIPGNGDTFIFVGKDPQSGTHIVQVIAAGESQGTVSSVAYFSSYTFPLAAAPVPGGYAVLHWNPDNKSQMQLSRLKNTTEQWTKSYNIEKDVEDEIMAHLTRQRQPLFPFQVGAAANGKLFFNGLNNTTLSLSFVNGENGDQTGIINGYQFASGISQALALEGGDFAISSFKVSGENVYTPAVQFSGIEVATAKDLQGNELPELSAFAGVKIRQLEIKGEKITFFGSTTKNGQIVILAYDESGVLKGVKYLGAGNRFEMGSIAASPEGGLVVLGRVFVAGRFSRLCLLKLSSQEVVGFLSK